MIASDSDVRNVEYLDATQISECGGPLSGNATTHGPLYFEEWYNRVSPPETSFNWMLHSEPFETRYESIKFCKPWPDAGPPRPVCRAAYVN